MSDAPGRITLGGRPSVPVPPVSKIAFLKVLRVLGVLFLLVSLAVLLVPSLTPGALFNVSNGNCGMVLEGLFAPPGSHCMRAAITKANFALMYAGIGVLFLTFSGTPRRLTLWGWAVALGSPYLMTQSGGAVRIASNVVGSCGTYLGDFSRRGIETMSSGGVTWTFGPACGEMALDRLYLTLGVAASGLLLVAVGTYVSRKQARDVASPPS